MRALIVALLCASPVLADEGELYLGGGAGLEGATLRHPAALAGARRLLAPPNAALARVGVGARYGLSNELHPGFGLELAMAGNVATPDVILAGSHAQIVTGTYLEAAAPIGAGWRFDSGYDLSAVVGVDVAPHVALWMLSAATAPPSSGDTKPPRALPIDVADAVGLGVSLRVRAAVELRLFEALALPLTPYLGVTWDGAPSWRMGMAVQPELITALWP